MLSNFAFNCYAVVNMIIFMLRIWNSYLYLKKKDNSIPVFDLYSVFVKKLDKEYFKKAFYSIFILEKAENTELSILKFRVNLFSIIFFIQLLFVFYY